MFTQTQILSISLIAVAAVMVTCSVLLIVCVALVRLKHAAEFKEAKETRRLFHAAHPGLVSQWEVPDDKGPMPWTLPEDE